jgi:DNA polymerase-3 subunit delta
LFVFFAFFFFKSQPVKLTAAQTTAFLKSPDAAIRVVLLYGPDAGLVGDRAKTLARLWIENLDDPFRVARLTQAQIADDPARLNDEMAALALGGGSRLIWVRAATDALAAPLAKALAERPQGDTRLLIEAGDLEKRSKLRALCESENDLVVALACYNEEGPQRLATINALLQAENLKASREVALLLSDTLPEDRGSLRSEMEKLILYVHGKQEVTEEDVRAILQNEGAAEMDDLAMAVASGEAKRAALLLNRLFAEQTSSVALLRALQRHFMRLHIARGHCEDGLSPREAVGKLQPKIFWKQESAFTAQVQKWNVSKIEAILARLFEAEAAVKQTGAPDEALTAQLLLQIAHAA